MKTLFIRLSTTPYGLAILITLSLSSLVIFHIPQVNIADSNDGRRETFPGRRRGGGTHLVAAGSTRRPLSEQRFCYSNRPNWWGSCATDRHSSLGTQTIS